jgi:hypothetical protein
MFAIGALLREFGRRQWDGFRPQILTAGVWRSYNDQSLQTTPRGKKNGLVQSPDIAMTPV